MLSYPTFRVLLGEFPGGAPAPTIALWQGVISEIIDIHESGGVSAYLVGDFGTAIGARRYVKILNASGITNVKPLLMTAAEDYLNSWDERVSFGTSTGQINPVVV